MKKTLVLGLAAIITGGVAHAQFELSTDITFASGYVFRGVQYGDMSLQPSIDISSETWYAGMWANLPTENQSSEGWLDEYDFYLGYTPKLSDSVTLDIGVTHYYYPLGEASTEGYIGASCTAGAFSPAAKLYYDFDLEALTIEGSIGFSVPMDNLGTSLDLTGYVGNVDPDVGDSYTYYGLDAAVPFKINENASINFALHWAKNDHPADDSDHFWGTVGLTIGF